MTSKRQLEANRSNARRSTGPRTTAGKARSSLNALKHGLCAKAILIGAERPEQFEELRSAVIAHYRPRSALAYDAADRYAATLWRLRRIPTIEAALAEAVHRRAYLEECKALEREHNAEVYDEARQECDAFYHGSETRILHARMTGEHQKNIATVFTERLSDKRFAVPRRETISAAQTLLMLIETGEPIDVLTKLNRYEAALMNVALRQRQELEALQRSAVDVKLLAI
jgi:hypothetical protein